MNDERARLGGGFLAALFLAGMVIFIGAAVPETAPGYMDADYYYAGAKRIAEGQGDGEPYLWNYLSDPASIPAPSFAYWMPLASLVAASGLKLFPAWGFWGARLPLILLSALVPPLSAFLSLRLTGKPSAARLAGVLALFPGFYLAYMPTSDVFALEMVLGGLLFVLILEAERQASRLAYYALSFGLGLAAGLLHLARADGVLWLGGAFLVALLSSRRAGRAWFLRMLASTTAVLVGYLLVMSPWMMRNLGEWGSLFPPGGSRALWVSEYEQTMVYPASLLTPETWLAAGWGTHLSARLDAVGVVLQSAIAVQGGILLFPFMLAGLWRLRSNAAVQVGAAMWALFTLVMMLMFPFAARNGSYFHTAAALQPLLWAAAPVGLENMMLRYAGWRKVSRPSGLVRFMALVAVITGIVLSGVTYHQRVVGDQPGTLAWNRSGEHYFVVETELARLGAEPGAAVMVNNPPGYWLASGRPALVIPYGDSQMLLAAARWYGARYLVLEQTNPWQLADLYNGREAPGGLEHLGDVNRTRLYRIEAGE